MRAAINVALALTASLFAMGAPGDGLAGSTQFRGETPARRKAGKRAGRYGKALVAYWNRKRAQERLQRSALRDENGAFTFVGPVVAFVGDKPDAARWYELGGESGPDGAVVLARRKWLAGVSAQRGY